MEATYGILLIRMVHDAAQPKTKQSAIKAMKARREELLKHQHATAATTKQDESAGATASS